MLRSHMMRYNRSTLGLRTIHSSRASLLFLRKPAKPEDVTTQAKAEQYEKHPILKRIPRFLRPYTTGFMNAPVSHVTAFLVLHEITAIVPLVGIWYVIHNYHDTFLLASLDLPSWAIEKGTKIIDKTLKDWNFADVSISEKYKFIREGAYAYVIVKGLFPIRLAFSLLGMPWFAKWFVLPITRMFSRKKVPKQTTEKVVEVNESAIQSHKAKTINKPRL